MKNFTFSLRVVAVLSCFGLLLGCSGSESDTPDTVSVSGTVYLDGQPAEGVEVTFVSEDPAFAGYGRTGADGRYTLVQGAVVGSNKVTISKMEGGEGLEINPEEGMDEGQFAAMADPATGVAPPSDLLPKQLIPEEYSDPSKSKLSYDVPEGGTDSADFRLQSK